MSPTPEPQVTPAPSAAVACAGVRLARAQTAIRRLTTRGGLTPAERLELAQWQREWVAAWKATSEPQYVIAA